MATYYGVDQADTHKLADILAHEYHGDPLDLVIDDASHLIEETRRSFNFLFPHLSPGGAYVIEDWSGAHTNFQPGPETPLSVLLFELMLTAAHRPGLIAEIAIREGLGNRSTRSGSHRSRFLRRVGDLWWQGRPHLMRNLSRPWPDDEPGRAIA